MNGWQYEWRIWRSWWIDGCEYADLSVCRSIDEARAEWDSACQFRWAPREAVRLTVSGVQVWRRPVSLEQRQMWTPYVAEMERTGSRRARWPEQVQPDEYVRQARELVEDPT